jgi:hypothetical protein
MPKLPSIPFVVFDYHIGMSNLTKKILLERLANMLMQECSTNPDEGVHNDPFNIVIKVRYTDQAKNHPHKHGHHHGVYPPLTQHGGGTAQVAAPTKSQYNTKCPKCGGPATLLFNTIDCPKGCQ